MNSTSSLTARATIAIIMFVAAGVLGGCASTPSKQARKTPIAEVDNTALMSMRKEIEYRNGSLYSAGHDVALFEDVKARHVGDILTIVLQERTDASKSASTSTSKSNEFNAASPTLFGRPISINNGRADLSVGLSSDGEFSGEGDASQSNSLNGNVSVVITEVLPNGNLKIEGQKVLTINQGDEHVRLAGIVRPVDIRADNTVLSAHVANAHFVYAGTGVIADANSMGWLGRFFNSSWWPF